MNGEVSGLANSTTDNSHMVAKNAGVDCLATRMPTPWAVITSGKRRKRQIDTAVSPANLSEDHRPSYYGMIRRFVGAWGAVLGWPPDTLLLTWTLIQGA